MARIRSLHPGQWTDEEFVSCSAEARLLALALRNEADDNGVFPWKPMTLKMRLLPTDNVDCAALLQELVDSGQVMPFDADGKSFGAIRNFHHFQSPKRPNPVYPMPEHVREWVGLTPATGDHNHGASPTTTGDRETPSADVPNNSPTCSEHVPPGGGEEGRGSGSGEEQQQPRATAEEPSPPGEPPGKPVKAAATAKAGPCKTKTAATKAQAGNANAGTGSDGDAKPDLAAACKRIQTTWNNPNAPNSGQMRPTVEKWLHNWQCDLERDVLPAIAEVVERKQARNEAPPNRLRYFDGRIWDRAQERQQAPPSTERSGGKPPDDPAEERRLREEWNRIIAPDF